MLNTIKWEMISVILGVVTITLSVIIFLLQRKRKELSFGIISATSLLEISSRIEDQLEILYEGKPTQSIHLIILKIINSGKEEIPPGDFIEPIKIDFPNPTKIISAEITKTEPTPFETKINKNNQGITIEPILLNAGDSITLTTLVSEFNNDLNLSGRIIGVKEIKHINMDSQGPEGLSAFATSVLFSSLFGIIAYYVHQLKGYSTEYLLLTISAVIGMAIIIILVNDILSRYKKLKKLLTSNPYSADKNQ